MNLKPGVYRSEKGTDVLEQHGGASLRHVFYSYLCFYVPESFVGYFSAGLDELQQYFNRSFDYQGRIVNHENNRIVVHIEDAFLGDRMIFEGTIQDDKLNLQMTRQSNPAKIVIDDTFVLVNNRSGE
jgi:hypothetical protein